MAVNLINSTDIEVVQDGQDISLELVNSIPVVDNSVSTSSTNAIENQAITNYVDTEITSVANKFDFSSIEQAIGTWVDGKPLYKQTFRYTGITIGQEQYINWNTSTYGNSLNDAEEIVHYEAYFKRSAPDGTNPTFQQVPMAHTDMQNWGNGIYDMTPTSFGFYVGAMYSIFVVNYLIITLYYTKTTD